MNCGNQFRWIRCFAAATIVTALVSSAALAGSVIYVDDDAPGGGDGASWETAYRFLQDALTDAAGGGISEIRVGQGTYKPDRDEANPGGTGDRLATYQLLSDVAVNGGFAGIGAPDPDERDVVLYQTILNGDIGVLEQETDNSKHVVTGTGASPTGVLDGFTITLGFADIGAWPQYIGAGMLIFGSGNPTIVDCLFVDNTAEMGGAVYVDNAATTVTNTRFANNCAFDGSGGAISVISSSITASNCVFEANTADHGGAVVISSSGRSSFTNCAFTANEAVFDGGAIYAYNITVTLIDCAFEGNVALGDNASRGGALALLEGSDADVQGCSFVGNSALTGGAVWVKDSTPSFVDCNFDQNTAQSAGAISTSFATRANLADCVFTNNVAAVGDGGAVSFGNGSDSIVTNCQFINNSARDGGGLRTDQNAEPIITGCTFVGNTASNHGGGFRGTLGTMSDCVFDGNTASNLGGGALCTDDDSIILNCTFVNNSASQGGGLAIGDNIFVADCTFTGNVADNGGAISASQDQPTFLRCLISGNTANANGGGFYLTTDTLALVVSCTIVGNTASLDGGGAFVFDDSIPTFVNCLFSGNLADSDGGGISFFNTDGTVVCCSFSANAAAQSGGGIWTSRPTILQNSILWGNSDNQGQVEDSQIHRSQDVPILMDNCCVQGLTGDLGGIGNIGKDPLFVDPDGPDDIPGTADDDVHLQKGSPVVNVGDNAFLPSDILDLDGDGDTSEPIPFDLDGLERVVNTVVDMGAYESTEFAGGPGVYIGPKGGTWFNPLYWEGGEIPGEGTHVFISVPVVIDQVGAVAASVTILDGGGLTITTGSLSTAMLVIVSGSWLEMNDPSAEINVENLDVEPGGNLIWISGTIRILGGTWNSPQPILIGCAGSAALHLVDDATVAAPMIQNCPSGGIFGDGTISGTLSNEGIMAPGTSFGTLMVTGDFTQTITGTLLIEIEDYSSVAQHDLLTIGAPATLGGTLEITISDPSEPQIVAFEVIQADSVLGQFDTVLQPDPPGDLIPGLQQTSTAVLVGLTAPGPRLFVDSDAPPNGTGTTWETALQELQPALTAASLSSGDISEIWVAAATYLPSMRTDANDARSVAFQLVTGVTIYGGFAGGEQNLEERDYVNNVTILSGDLNGDDGPDFANNGENAYHVAIGSGVAGTGAVDGFTIQGGNANNNATNFTRRGAGLYSEGGSPTVRNCMFTSNWANGEGGALFNGLGSSPTIENCSFLANTSAAGGAIGNVDNSSPVVSDCEFVGNFGGLSGGAVANINSSSPTISDSTFANNSSGEVGGAISNGFDCNPSIRGCHFDGNASSIEGGAIFSQFGDPFLSGCTFVNNLIGIRGGAVYNEQNNAIFVNCTFIGNLSESRGGAVYNDAGSDATLIQCYFTGNYALRYGGAIYNNADLITITNSTFSANVADYFEGGGIYNKGSAPSILANCILWGNTSNFGLVNEDAQIISDPGPGNITVNYSCIQGLTGDLGGTGNIGVDPRFVDADGPDNTAGTLDDNLQLFFNSPSIDAGSNFKVPADLADLDDDGNTSEPLPFDLAGNDRFVDDRLTPDTGAGDPPIVDMGPYEFGPVCAGCPGPRLWIDPTGGSYNEPANWHPDLPAEVDSVIFDLSSSYTVTLSNDVTNDSLIVTDGNVTLALNGNLYDLTNAAQETLHVGMLPGSAASLTLDGGTMLAPSVRVGGDPGSTGELTIDSTELIIADAVNIGELSPGSLVLLNGAMLNTGAGVIVYGQGEVSGDGAILGNLTNFGVAAPGAGDYGVLVVNGNYQQLASGLGPVQNASTLRIDLGGSIPGVEFDVLEVNGEATLGGRLVVTADPDFEPQLGESFAIVTADSILGEFDIAFLPPVFGDLVLTIQYDDGGKGGPGSVKLVVEELDVDFFTFDDPMFFGDFLPPTDAILVDVDNDDDLDVVMTIPAADDGKGGPDDPGAVAVFINLGVGMQGQWNGFIPVPVQTPVQEQPVSLASGFFNDDEHVDLVVANFQFGRISVLLNNGTGNGSFTEHQIFDVDNGARSVAAGPLYGNSVDDLVVLTGVLSRQRFFGNDGSGTFSLVQSVNGAGFDGHITTLDADGDGDPEVISAGTLGVNVTFRNDQSGLFGPGGDHYPVTEGTIDLRTADLDNSGFGDIITINQTAGLVSVLLNLSDGTGVMAPAIDLQVGNAPSSLATVDIDADGDLDLAIAAENELGERVVRLKRNELIDGQLGFTDISSLPVNGLARIVLAGDLNGDSRPDLIAINDETAILAGGVLGSSMSVHVNATGALPCPWDLDDNGSVGATDLLSLLVTWGPCDDCNDCPADFDGNCTVGATDLLALLVNWGPCP